jgi:hypothetical protein
MPERVLTPAEREALKQACLKHMSATWGQSHVRNLLQTHNDFIDFCYLIQEPENHIKIASGQYVEKQVYVRQVHDMSDEMAQELINLPRFTAYAKVIEEKDGIQSVWKGKIKTLMLPDQIPQAEEDTALVVDFGHQLSKKREEIEKEIRERQEKWRRIDPQPPSEPPEKPPPPTRF